VAPIKAQCPGKMTAVASGNCTGSHTRKPPRPPANSNKVGPNQGFSFKFLRSLDWLGSLTLIRTKWRLSVMDSRVFTVSSLVLATSSNTLSKYGEFYSFLPRNLAKILKNFPKTPLLKSQSLLFNRQLAKFRQKKQRWESQRRAQHDRSGSSTKKLQGGGGGGQKTAHRSLHKSADSTAHGTTRGGNIFPSPFIGIATVRNVAFRPLHWQWTKRHIWRSAGCRPVFPGIGK